MAGERFGRKFAATLLASGLTVAGCGSEGSSQISAATPSAESSTTSVPSQQRLDVRGLLPPDAIVFDCVDASRSVTPEYRAGAGAKVFVNADAQKPAIIESVPEEANPNNVTSIKAQIASPDVPGQPINLLTNAGSDPTIGLVLATEVPTAMQVIKGKVDINCDPGPHADTAIEGSAISLRGHYKKIDRIWIHRNNRMSSETR